MRGHGGKIMGCVNACICGGMCVGCSAYEPERYCGEAEDLYDELHGNEDIPYDRIRETNEAH